MAFTLVGALRFFANEEALLRGRVKTNGWDLWLAVCLVFVVGHAVRHSGYLTDHGRLLVATFGF